MEQFLNETFQSAYSSYLLEEGMSKENIVMLFKNNDIASTRFADFQYNGIIRIFRALKQIKPDVSMTDVASNVISRVLKLLASSNIIQCIDHDKNFINITLNNNFILNTVVNYGNHLIKNGPTHYDMFESFDFPEFSILKSEASKQKIIVDYSSPNVAKSLHIGHLRSTVIGETIVRLLINAGHEVIGLNHVGDWGTQFGMIINYLKKMYLSSDLSSEEDLINFVESADSKILMDIYRNAKREFDKKNTTAIELNDTEIVNIKSFADESREQTYKLQQGDPLNTKIWKAICSISSKEYSGIYELLNIQHLTERGESFYQSIIPDVLKMLDESGMLINENGATIINLPEWTYPLMMIKSDGGYTYDTTDLAALYHRLCIMNADTVIYITDSGQKSHFDMCFDVANKMGWTRPKAIFDRRVAKRTSHLPTETEQGESKKLIHIGFGLVLGKDGTKLKTRSGDVVKMLDVIDDVVELSKNIICKRIEKSKTLSDNGHLDTDPTSVYYQNISDSDIITMSKRIGLNTLKYFDLSHRFDSNYKYDPDFMFKFNGDTGVYLMYCFARINGIIEKSTIVSDLGLKRDVIETIQPIFDNLNFTDVNEAYFTKETRELMIHIMNFESCLIKSTRNLNTVDLTKYIFALCTYFNTFISQKNGRIINSRNEAIGIVVCLIVSKIIEQVFYLLSFEPVDHI